MIIVWFKDNIKGSGKAAPFIQGITLQYYLLQLS